MHEFMAKHQDTIAGTLSGFARLALLSQFDSNFVELGTVLSPKCLIRKERSCQKRCSEDLPSFLWMQLLSFCGNNVLALDPTKEGWQVAPLLQCGREPTLTVGQSGAANGAVSGGDQRQPT